MFKKTAITSILGISGVGLLLGMAPQTSADNHNTTMTHKQNASVKFDMLTESLEKEDFEMFKKAHEGKVKDSITEEQFKKMLVEHKERKEKKMQMMHDSVMSTLNDTQKETMKTLMSEAETLMKKHRDSMKDMSPEARKAAMESHKTEMKTLHEKHLEIIKTQGFPSDVIEQMQSKHEMHYKGGMGEMRKEMKQEIKEEMKTTRKDMRAQMMEKMIKERVQKMSERMSMEQLDMLQDKISLMIDKQPNEQKKQMFTMVYNAIEEVIVSKSDLQGELDELFGE